MFANILLSLPPHNGENIMDDKEAILKYLDKASKRELRLVLLYIKAILKLG